MISIRCKDCNNELTGHPSRTVSCGCPNMATIRGDKISANDLSHIVMLNNMSNKKNNNNVLKNEDLLWQEERKKRKIRKLDFEIR